MMTTPITNRPSRARRRGFTLIELLVVIAIMALLLSIMTGGVIMYRRSASIMANQALIATIRTGIDAYYQDFNEYPVSYADPAYAGAIGDDRWYGAEMLAQMMMGHLEETYDGEDGLGFRVIRRGRVHGPYVSSEKFQTATFDGRDKPCFADSWGRPIVYYRFDHQNDLYDSGDNPTGSGEAPSDINAYAQEGSSGGRYYRRDYILATPGPDGEWRPAGDNPDDADDVTNLLME